MKYGVKYVWVNDFLVSFTYFHCYYAKVPNF